MELPQYLFKYITWEKDFHKRMIIENEIFFTSAKNFNDPFDSSVPLRYDLGTEEQILDLYKSHIKRDHLHLSSSEIERVAINEMRINKVKDHKVIERNLDSQRKWAIEKYGIFAMTSEYKNILLWSHYADSHQGICVRFNCERFLEFIRIDCVKNKLLIVWDKIDYQTDYPLLNPFELNDNDVVLKSLLIKSYDWKYENEFRFILFDNPNKAIIIPDGIIDQVILGCNISDKDKNTLVEVTKEKNIELLQSIIKRNTFGLDIVKINI